MDNRVFNVNGQSKEHLIAALKLAFEIHSSYKPETKGWKIVPNKGMVLLWSTSNGGNPFPVPLGANDVGNIVWEWLQSDEAKKIELTGEWDGDFDHDGDNELGWRVYCEGWGHVGSDHYSIVAVTPAYMWYGK